MDSEATRFALQGADPFLHWLTLGILCIMPFLVVLVLYKLGGLPGAIARARNHPQADAISVCGWMGIITIILWPVAMVWAHVVQGRMIGKSDLPSQNAPAASARLREASERLAAVERKLAQTGA